MPLLRTLTLIYAAMLTSALGASLAAILVYLRRIAGTLGEVGAALAVVQQENQTPDVALARRQDRAIQVMWWIGLIGALIATLAILKEVALVLRALRDIQRLAGITREAAQGVAANLAAGSRLAGTEDPAREVGEAAAALASAVAALEQKLDALVPVPMQ